MKNGIYFGVVLFYTMTCHQLFLERLFVDHVYVYVLGLGLFGHGKVVAEFSRKVLLVDCLLFKTLMWRK